MIQLSTEFFIQLGYALGVGVLVGLERSVQVVVKRDPTAQPDGSQADAGEIMGVRTFAVLSLLGFLAALAGERFSPLASVGVVGASALILAMYVKSPPAQPGITTETAGIATCLLGLLCRTHPHEAGVLALLLTVILAAKRFTWDTIRRMRRVELTDTLKFLVVILIVLPLLPREALDPWGAFNPYKVGFLVVLISGIGFVGYFLTRILGARRGLGITGIVGGLTSSTAVTAAMAQEAKRRPELTLVCAFSTVAANATMFGRVLVVVFLLDTALGRQLAFSVGAMGVTAILLAVGLWVKAGKANEAETQSEVELKNPFSVGPALKFAAFFVFILFIMRLAKEHFGSQGLYLAALLSGLADVDAITLSMAEQSKAGTVARDVGSLAITIAVVSNGVVKSGIAWGTGGRRFGIAVGACLGVAMAVGLVLAVVF